MYLEMETCSRFDSPASSFISAIRTLLLPTLCLNPPTRSKGVSLAPSFSLTGIPLRHRGIRHGRWCILIVRPPNAWRWLEAHV